MRAWTDGERHGVETEPHDAELASAVDGTLSAIADLAHAWKGTTPGGAEAIDGAPGTCFNCRNERPLRPLVVESKEHDGPEVVGACAECQNDFVNKRMDMLTAKPKAQAKASTSEEPEGDTMPPGIENYLCPACKGKGEDCEECDGMGVVNVELGGGR